MKSATPQAPPRPSDQLSDQEWDELQALRLAISEQISSVHPAQQERFAQLFVRSLRGKGDPPNNGPQS